MNSVMQLTSFIIWSIMSTCYRCLEGLLKTVVVQNIVRTIKIQVTHLFSFCYHQNIKIETPLMIFWSLDRLVGHRLSRDLTDCLGA